MLRYVERNALRANLVERAQDGRWSSASPRQGDVPLLDLGPVRRGLIWLDYVNEPQTDAEVKRLRECIRRGRPFGALPWMTDNCRPPGIGSEPSTLGPAEKGVRTATVVVWR